MSNTPPPPLSTVQFFDILGGRFSLGPGEYLALLRNKAMQTYLLVVYVLLLLTDAPSLLGNLHIGLVLPLWCAVMGCFLFSVWAVISMIAWVQKGIAARLWPGPVLVVAALVPAVTVGEILTYLFTDGALGFDLFPHVLLYWIIAEMFGLIFIRYVRPHIEGTARVETALPNLDRQIVVGGATFALARLRHIEAREHHVIVTLDGETLTHRARLGDIVAQTYPEDGLQPHRSWWVAASVAQTLTRDGTRHVLQLDDGTHIPVARSRLDEVRDWLARKA
jgi:hypothetical protein